MEELYKYEKLLWSSGYKYVAGCDEAGRGPLFGPVVAAAVILPKDFVLEGLNDSKKLTEKKREELYDIIIKDALAVGVGIISAKEIDEIISRTLDRDFSTISQFLAVLLEDEANEYMKEHGM